MPFTLKESHCLRVVKHVEKLKVRGADYISGDLGSGRGEADAGVCRSFSLTLSRGGAPHRQAVTAMHYTVDSTAGRRGGVFTWDVRDMTVTCQLCLPGFGS